MGRIFGISDNPVSTIESALRGLDSVPKSPYPTKIVPKLNNNKDTFVATEKPHKSNAFVKMRNGFGKLMSQFKTKK